jgi:hypothetical protein
MTPVPLVGGLSRLLGYMVFLVWCAAMIVALAVVGLLRIGRLAGQLGAREPAASLR